MRDIIVGKIYRHVSGNYYRVICIANDSTSSDEDGPKQIVVYETFGPKRTVWVRPYELFNALNEDAEYVQKYRFEEVDDYIKIGE